MKTLTPTNDAYSLGERERKAKPAKGFRKYVLYGVLVLVAVLLLSHVAWNQSGSNQWELATDEEGVKVWTLKTPGSNLVKVKATTRIKSRLSGMVKLLEDLESCVDAQCYDAKVLQPIETIPGRYAAYIRFKFDVPGFRTQDFVLFQEHVQDPGNGLLEINLMAAPNRIARDECCARVTHLHNNWKLQPRENGELDVEFTQDTDMESVPYFLVNFALTQGTFEILKQLQTLMDMDKYKNARVGHVQDGSFN